MDIGSPSRKTEPHRIGRWTFWIALLVVATAVMLWARGDIEQSHVALTLLLVVVGGSAGGGRRLGFTLAVLGFLAIDYFFQAPYDQITVGKPLDWVVLVAFLSVAFVATELVTRARNEAEEARRRGDEISALARLGSETLRFARAEDALDGIAQLVQDAIRPRRTAIRLFETERTLAPEPIAARGGEPLEAEERVVELVANDNDSHRLGFAAASLLDGSLRRAATLADFDSEPLETIVLPLVVETRRVGVLMIGCHGAPRYLSPALRRFLSALAYYAALGAERLRLAREAERAREMEEETRAKDQVLATVSHDLRAPLTAIKLLAQSAAARGDPNSQSIEDEVDRLAEFVTNVLSLSRIRAGGLALDCETNTAEDLVGSALRQVAPLQKGRSIVPRIDLDEPMLLGRFDFVQSLRILTNLLDNALRYTPIGGTVEVSASGDDDWLRIDVADRGPGVAEAERSRIFAPFYRPRSEAPDVGHAGLGLSIARHLAELQGGTLAYEPRPGGGSIFVLKLPAADMSDVDVRGERAGLPGYERA